MEISLRKTGSRWLVGAAIWTIVLLVPRVATAGEAPPGTRSQLSAALAVNLMRIVLRREFGAAWEQASGHRLSCPVHVVARRGGHGPLMSARRRCYFEWSSAGTRYSGRGLIWLTREGGGKPFWVFQFKSTERTGRRVRTFNQSGSVRPVPPG